MFGLPIWADLALRGLMVAVALATWTLLLVRLAGLRSLSEMTAVDFVSTIAIGSLVGQAGSVSTWRDAAQTAAAIAGLFLFQMLVMLLQRRSGRIRHLVRNQPVLLMEDGKFLEHAMARTSVSREDMWNQLRAASVTDLASVRAVVLETTGNLSVLQGDHLDPALLNDVKRLPCPQEPARGPSSSQ